jgi:tRNA uridine 5-carboxymethylaminomethyl modification enzyme
MGLTIYLYYYRKMTILVEQHYDVIVVGGGHAGIEAAMASAKLGCKTLMMCMNLDTIGQMSCNPAIGGPAKSQLVKEIDALGGVMGICADATYLQLKTLNLSKGPAVQALRAQSDKTEYRQFARLLVETEPNLFLRQTMASQLKFHPQTKAIRAVVDSFGIEYPCGAVILTTGTFMHGKLFVGETQLSGGRPGEASAIGITADLVAMGMQTGRLKTGTPPRLDGRTIDYSGLSEHPGDENPSFFSFLPNRPIREQLPCHMTRTTLATHRIIEENIHRSPMYQGLIEGCGPRYCPSIEDKVVRFADKDSHHLFIEPESRGSYEIYLQGFSSSLPIDVQYQMLKTLPGLENVSMIRPACAVEYDYFPAFQLEASLMSKLIPGLWMAGQINGTSGYEEAAAQGLIAGINAAHWVGEKPPVVLSRDSSYIGTLIDDLVTKEIREPYRMMTSRSEYRLLLRQDNADKRLTPLGYSLGLVNRERWETYQRKQDRVSEYQALLKACKPKLAILQAPFEEHQLQMPHERMSLFELLRRPPIQWRHLEGLLPCLSDQSRLSDAEALFVETEIKYAGYIEKQTQSITRVAQASQVKLPEWLEYKNIKQLSHEAREKLAKLKPETLAQAARIAGVSPADISILQIMIRNGKKQFEKAL